MRRCRPGGTTPFSPCHWGPGGKHAASLCPAPGVHWESLLAPANTCPSSACHCEPVQNGNRGAPVRPGEGDAAERLKTWIFLRKSRGEGCAACIAEVWQSVSPQRNLASWLPLGQTPSHQQIRLESRPCTREHLSVFSMSLRTSAHTCGNPFSPQGSLTSWCYFRQIRMRFFVFARSTAFCYALPQGDADCHVASLLAMTEGGRPCTR